MWAPAKQRDRGNRHVTESERVRTFRKSLFLMSAYL